MLLYRAADQLGIPRDAADAAEEAGLLEVRERLTFRHPLVRSAAYRSASPQERRLAHGASPTRPILTSSPIAARGTGPGDGSAGEDVAAELEGTAERAQARGGLAAAAAFLEQASALTPDPARQAERRLRAAELKQEAGAFDDAMTLLGFAEAGSLDELQAARCARVRARITVARQRDTPSLLALLDAARRLGPLDTGLAQETALEVLTAAYGVGIPMHPGRGAGPGRGAATGSSHPAELLLRGWGRLLNDGYPAGTDSCARP